MEEVPKASGAAQAVEPLGLGHAAFTGMKTGSKIIHVSRRLPLRNSGWSGTRDGYVSLHTQRTTSETADFLFSGSSWIWLST